MPKLKRKFIGFDTETTGLDLNHGCKPFLLTFCTEDQENEWVEWDVDPLTREPQVVEEDLEGLIEKQKQYHFVLHNPKFDVRAVSSIDSELEWNWDKTWDILVAAHLVASNQPKDLTTLSLIHLGYNVKPFEDEIQNACNEARRMARSQFPEWKIAREGMKELPSAKGKLWKNDMWLPRALAQELNYPDDHPWWTVCSDYANMDSSATIALFLFFREKLKELGLWELYNERRKVLPILHDMEQKGITLSKRRLHELQNLYAEDFEHTSSTCISIAEKYDHELKLPRGAGNTKSLMEFCFEQEYLDLPIVSVTAKGNPSLDKAAKAELLLQAEPGSDSHTFLKHLGVRSKRGTSISYMQSYQKFMVRAGKNKDLYKLHSSLNPTGTDTLRMSSQNPNQQQISKQYDEWGHNLRYIFGPPKGKLWVSIDYDNLELRIPAFECGEPAMLELFENPDVGPFYGSYHMLIASILWPKEWKEVGKDGEEFKSKYKDTKYQWTKNGNFAELYGAVDTGDGKGTADIAFHQAGAQEKIAKRLTKKNKLNKDWIEYAEEHGFVTTLPDSEVDPDQGYPLWCSRTKWGEVKPTIPLNYHVQGTACWIMMRAMIKVQDYIQDTDARIVMNIHDELVIEFDRSTKWKPRVKKIKSIMASVGDCLIPKVTLTCGADVHYTSWSKVDETI